MHHTIPDKVDAGLRLIAKQVHGDPYRRPMEEEKNGTEDHR